MKTAVREVVEGLNDATGQDIADVAASFQSAAARHLASQTRKAMIEVSRDNERGLLVVAGGVAANCAVKSKLQDSCSELGWRLAAPPPKYCTDNGAMIAWAGAERLAGGLAPIDQDVLMRFAPRSRWPLATPPPGAAFGSGRKGPKA